MYKTLDITELDSHKQILDEAFSKLSRLDVILIAPGILPANEALDHQFPAFNVNATCTLVFSQIAGEALKAQGSGALAAISSVAGDRDRQSNYWYGAAKGGVSVFLSGLCNKLYEYGIAVTTIKPGFVKSP